MSYYKIEPRTLVSNLWIFVLMNMFLRDLHEFPTEGYIDELSALHISEEVMLIFAFLGEIPIVMILLSRILPNTSNKWANVFGVLIGSLGIAYTLPAGDLDEWFFAAVNAVAFVIIIRTVWKLPRRESVKVKS